MELCKSRIVRAKELAKRLGISRTTLWRWERHGRIPKKRRVGPNVTGWLVSDIDAWWNSPPPGDEETPTEVPR